MSTPQTMVSRAEAYLAERRRLGFALDTSGDLTLDFASFADANSCDEHLTADIVLQWAKQEAKVAKPFTWARRVNVLKPFARYLKESEPKTEFPSGAPFGRAKRRLAPHIFTLDEIERLVMAARRLAPEGGLASATFTTLFGLLASTGLRISEALHLHCNDLDEERSLLTIRNAKFQRSRLVPLHPTTTKAVHTYLQVRARYGPTDRTAPLFLCERTGNSVKYSSVRHAFLRVSGELGIVARGGHRAIRIHDLRHTFICRRLMLWQENGADIGNAMMALSTYVGHVNVGDTYWYLQAVPELMAIAGNRFETLGRKFKDVDHD